METMYAMYIYFIVMILLPCKVTYAVPVSPIGKCQQNYTQLPTGCYLDTGQLVTKDNGIQICDQMGGHLVVIGSDYEMDNVTGYIQSLGSRPNEWMMMGIYKQSHNPLIFTEIQSLKPVSWARWHHGEPNNAYELCAFVHINGAYFHDADCTHPAYIVCEKENALMSKATSCDFCGLRRTVPATDNERLLDGEDSTCVEIQPGHPNPSNIIFELLNNDKLRSVSVEILAQRCDFPYLTLIASDSCIEDAMFECKLTSDTQHNLNRKCSFDCKTGGSCIVAQVVIFGEKDTQRICEIKILN